MSAISASIYLTFRLPELDPLRLNLGINSALITVFVQELSDRRKILRVISVVHPSIIVY